MTSSKPYDDYLFRKFVKCLVRIFYDDIDIVVADGLVEIQAAVKDDQLAAYVKLHTKDVRASLELLVRDQICISEVIGSDNKAKTLYRMSPHVIDCIKWRLDNMEQDMKDSLRKAQQSSEYQCQSCDLKYDVLKAVSLTNLNTMFFECEVCKSELQMIDQASEIDRCKLQLDGLKQLTKHLSFTLDAVADMTVPVFEPLKKAVAPVETSQVPGLAALPPVPCRPMLATSVIPWLQDADSKKELYPPPQRPALPPPKRIKLDESSEEFKEQVRLLKEEHDLPPLDTDPEIQRRDPFVYVQGVQYKFSVVHQSQDLQEAMSPAEYQHYYSLDVY